MINRRNFLKLSCAAAAVPIASKTLANIPVAETPTQQLYVELELFGRRWPIPVYEEPQGTINAIGDLVINIEKEETIPFETKIYLGNVWPELREYGIESLPFPLFNAPRALPPGDTLTIAWPSHLVKVH